MAVFNYFYLLELDILFSTGAYNCQCPIVIQNKHFIVGNKIRDESEKEFITASLPGSEFLGFIPYDPAITEADLARRPILESSRVAAEEVKKIYAKLVSSLKQTPAKL